MKKINLAIFLSVVTLTTSSCTTTGHFKIPKNTELRVYERYEPISLTTQGYGTVKPFFWTAFGIPPRGGIPYNLTKNGRVVKSGKLRTKFRVASIFWPPFAIIYWPAGFNENITYDLVNDRQE